MAALCIVAAFSCPSSAHVYGGAGRGQLRLGRFRCASGFPPPLVRCRPYPATSAPCEPSEGVEAMVRFVTIKKFSDQSGYTEDAIRSKIRDGIWREGSEWIRAPDGRNLIDTEGYEKWVE